MDTPPLTLEEALVLYRMEFLSARNFTELTRITYMRDLREVIDYLTTTGHLHQPGQVSRLHLEAFLAALDRRQLSGNYRRRKVAAIRSFFAFCTDRGFSQTNSTLKLIPPEREHKEPRYLSETEYKRLTDAVRFHPRDAAIIEVLLQTGMRLSEICRLRTLDVQLPEKARITADPGNIGQVTIAGKGRKQRTVTLNWKACQALKAYYAVRPDSPYPEIFITKYQRPIGPRSVEKVVGKYLDQAGIEGATVHTMRHTFATAHVRKKTDLKVVQTALGHANIATTSRYVGLVREEMNKQLQENAL